MIDNVKITSTDWIKDEKILSDVFGLKKVLKYNLDSTMNEIVVIQNGDVSLCDLDSCKMDDYCLNHNCRSLPVKTVKQLLREKKLKRVLK